MNKCVYDKLVRAYLDLARVWAVLTSHNLQKLEKVIPDTPEGETPVHLRKKQIYAHYPQ